MENFTENTLKNENHYDKVYSKVNIHSIISKLNNLEVFLQDATRTDTSWVGFYYGQFQNQLKGKRVLELGCGDCLNAAVMAALGAEVFANDISQKSGEIIKELNAHYNFQFPIQFVKGDFLQAEIIPDFFDFVVGKSFVHHLTNDQEIEFTKKIVRALKPDGRVRYSEPAVNSIFLDKLRWIIPMPDRPSILQKEKFKKFKLKDPHPERDNSAKHYRMIGNEYFYHTEIHPIGTLERFCRFVSGKQKRPLRRLAFRIEKYIPKALNLKLARSQVIDFQNPKKTIEC